MQDVGPDMEELFRRASEDYPLKQGEDRWSEIELKINDKPSSLPANKPQTWYRKYYAVLLFLLLFVSIEYIFFRQFPIQNTGLQKSQTNRIEQVPNFRKTDKAIAYKISEKAKSVKPSAVSKNSFNVLQLNPLNRNSRQHIISTKAGIQDETIENLQSVNQSINFTNDFGMNKVLNKSAPSVMNIKEVALIQANNNSLSNINSSDSGKSEEHFTSSSSNSVEKKITNKTSMHKFYYGFQLGPELNSINNQDLKKVGSDIGIIGGYRFSKHLSAETGLLLSKKNYTTAGKYFSLKVIGPMMPAGMKVMEVKGTSNVVEIPVHLRYDILNKKDHRFFSSAGFSSYILTKESNKYYTSLNGTDYLMYGTYRNNKSYFASSLDLAIGYEKNFGKQSNIRFQPYVQLPIKGIGVGNLKVSSAGVHIAITRSAK